MPQIATDQRPAVQLSPPQIAALEALVSGSTVTDAARTAAVSRETLHRWLRDDFEFIAARNAAVSDLRTATSARMEKAAAAAAEVVLKAVESGDIGIAIKVLQGVGCLSGDGRSSVGPCTVAELRSQRAAHARTVARTRRLEAAFGSPEDEIDDLGL